MRTISHSRGIEISSEDRMWFKDIITGYPPQVIYCTNYICENGVDLAKKQSHIFVEINKSKTAELLNSAFDDENREYGYHFLAFLSAYGIVPMTTIVEVFELNNRYADIFNILLSFTLCRIIGMSMNYVEVHPMVCDYMQRSSHEMSSEIRTLLKQKLENFNINSDDADFESTKYYLKEDIKSGKEIPQKFLYSTLYLNSIKELYDDQKYKNVIEIVVFLKSNDAFNRFETKSKDRIQRYFCLALARQADQSFFEEVNFFHGNVAEYKFLMGFMYRQQGKFSKALEFYLELMKESPNHKGVYRELVSVYRAMEDYDSFKAYAKYNYHHDPNNPYHIQPYFEALVFSKEITTDEENEMQSILKTIEIINSQNPLIAYYEIKSLYYSRIEHSRNKAMDILHDGETHFADSSYIYRALFDCCELYNDTDGMISAIKKLEKIQAQPPK